MTRHAIVPILALALACGSSSSGTVVRGDDMQGLDDAAFSTGLDARDLDTMYGEIERQAHGAAAVQRLRDLPERPVVSVLPFRNETTEHVDSQLQALIRKVETSMINSGSFRVVSIDTQPALVEEIRRQQGSGAYDQTHVASWGQQLGAQYLVEGRVYSADERTADQRRVQYFLFLRILDVSTGEILFQGEASTTKAIVQQ